jgi:hypothetical protein
MGTPALETACVPRIDHEDILKSTKNDNSEQELFSRDLIEVTAV